MASTKYYNGTILEEEYEKKLEVSKGAISLIDPYHALDS